MYMYMHCVMKCCLSLYLKREAHGEVYIDDGHSTDYKTGSFVVREFEFNRYKFTSKYVFVVI